MAVRAPPLAVRRAAPSTTPPRSPSTAPACAASATPTTSSATSSCGASRPCWSTASRPPGSSCSTSMAAVASAEPHGDDGPRRVPGARAAAGDRGHVDAGARGDDAARVRAGPVHDARSRRRRRGADLDQRRPGRPGAARAHGARRGRRHRGDLRAPSPGACSACAGRSAGRGRSTTSRAPTWWSWPAASGWRRCGRRSCGCSHGASATGGSSCCTAAGRPTPPLPRASSRGWDAAVTVDAAGRDWRGRVGVVTKLIDGAAFDPGSAVAHDVRARGDDALRRRGAARAAAWRADRAYVSMERNMQCGIGHCGHCQLGPTLVCRDGPVYTLGGARAVAGDPGAVSRAEAGRVEVRLLRRLPAHRARLRGRAARARRRGRDRVLPRGVARDGRGPVRRLARRGVDHDGRRRRADPAGPRAPRARSSRSARARRRAASRRCATSPTSTSSCRSSTRDPSTSRRWRRRRRSPRTCRSTSSCAAARSTSASCSR